ncbi:polyamine ABC transporter substrate-binding protein [Herbaspirillum sp. DW155]|uniref:ABC transporter substrate-binding protein n=1 Tax=Herbaspirillum sp. DW155 TaxID=3095609 RepID=UPI00308DCC84|nr:polyamine ABC transporter substrate-binding protein [Herbaspirillum sp. DW155]
MLLKKLTVLSLASTVLLAHAAEPVTVISFGGLNKQAQEKAFYRPFEKSGLGSVRAAEYNGEMAKVKAMAETGKVSWDVVEVESPDLIRGCNEGLFESLDWSKIGDKSQFLPSAVSECGVGIFIWSTVLAYDSNKLSKAPTSWADFWDTKTFPGKRALRKTAKFTLEFALLADGVKREDVYKVLATPAGVDRAFRKLDQLKPNIQWWEAGAQPLQWLVSGDVVMTSAYNGRVTAAQGEGHKLNIVWTDSLYDMDSWAIVKGSPNKDQSMKFIAFASKPESQKAFAETIPYGTTNKRASAMIDPKALQNLPTAPDNLHAALSVNTQFWIDNGEQLEQRFNAWAAK